MGMTHLSPEEQRLLDHAAAAPMLDQVQRWAAINSGSRNLPGLAQMASLLADAFSVLPGDLLLVDNIRYGHSREAYSGPRSVGVAMAGMFWTDDVV